MIRQALVNWHRATESLLSISGNVSDEKRDEAIKKIEKLLDVRDQLQPEIKAPFTKEEEALGKELTQLEVTLQAQLAIFIKGIRQDISVAQSKKTNMKNYVNPYGNMARDGAYYDTKQ
ncbi:flagellar protein FliT [Sporosarcina pasteurii]|uniref:Flagellar protein FliT n=1 Tax=Sporosarcina pasteurii TaxID=1474 RepID=A0A380BFV8_SPOPA|nr:flagellar protein FliT [Sporosarcina pasteurii]MDS9470336.1 flagellar protein FliT [Sporosarcina pasteurii]QBQ05951.1 flagellar protein FliT [Sporosarcina pasteurii]SUI99833.1 Uncharacterised protein [Sporosarcina pasteurii]